MKRDRSNGRYTFDGNMERLCVCGHTLGKHCAEAPHDCLAHSMSDATPDEKACQCPKFRPSRKKNT